MGKIVQNEKKNILMVKRRKELFYFYWQMANIIIKNACVNEKVMDNGARFMEVVSVYLIYFLHIIKDAEIFYFCSALNS